MLTVTTIFARYPLIRYVCALLGFLQMLFIGPMMGLTKGLFVFWFIYVNGAQDSAIFCHPLSNFSKQCARVYEQFVRYKEDVFCLNTVIAFGGVLPIFFFLIMYVTRVYELPFYVHFAMWYAYSFYRIGPASMHFAYVHTLCHKEGHTKLGIFKLKWLNNAFNWWIGLFYGLMPGTYSCGHSINHHGFNNYEGDLVSTGWANRDSLVNWFAYLVQWQLYHLNLTSILSFYYGPKNLRRFIKNMVAGVTYYWAFVALCYVLSGYNAKFVFWYLTYPMLEAMTFLSMVNWSWHLFLDPDDVNNEYVSSITLFNGPSNVLNEDYHLVHHQYPAHHWTKHPQLFEKHQKEYVANMASVFQGTHALEMFYLGATGQFKKIADKYDRAYLPKDMTDEQLIELIKRRVQTTLFDQKGDLRPLTKEN